MPIIKGKLIVDDIAFTILHCNYAFYKHIDERGQPYQGHSNKALRFTLEARKEATLFFDWIKHPTMMKHCRAEFASIHGTTKGHKIELYDAHCVEYGREFNHQGSTPFLVYVTLTAATIVIDGQEAVAHPWRITDPKRIGIPPLQREEELEEKVIDYYITDVKGNKKANYNVGDEIYLVVKTQNMIGKFLTINLRNKTKDFKYNGEILVNDTIENYPINSDLIKFKLEVVKPQKNMTYE